MQPMTFAFFGIVGSGKGTQIKLLMDLLSKKDGREIVYAYPGDEYRKLIKSETYVGNIIKDSVTRGELQPDFLTTSIFTNIIVAGISPEKHIIADGYPRRVVQSQDFEAMMKFFSRTDVKIVYIKVGREEAMKRNLLRGRDDDTEKALNHRFDEYENNVIPAMNYFKDKSGYEVIEINGEQSVEAVHADIVKALKI